MLIGYRESIFGFNLSSRIKGIKTVCVHFGGNNHVYLFFNGSKQVGNLSTQIAGINRINRGRRHGASIIHIRRVELFLITDLLVHLVPFFLISFQSWSKFCWISNEYVQRNSFFPFQRIIWTLLIFKINDSICMRFISDLTQRTD